MKIVHVGQFGSVEESNQIVGFGCHSPQPDSAAESRGPHCPPPTSALRNFCGSELPGSLPGSFGSYFVSKLGLVLEETDETLFWLELLVDAGIQRQDQVLAALDEANQLVSIFVASLRTVKGLKSEI